MKTRNLIWTAALSLAGSCWAGGLLAQTNLDALMKKCESMDKVDVEVIYNKDRKTKKPVKESVMVTFSQEDNPGLLEEFREAFKKDREDAYKVIESKRNGKTGSVLYRFDTGDGEIAYSMEEVKDAPFPGGEGKEGIRVRVTKIEHFLPDRLLIAIAILVGIGFVAPVIAGLFRRNSPPGTKAYLLWLLAGAALAVYFGYFMGYPVQALLALILVYRPVVDYHYIKKRGLFKGRHLILKYPFWGYGRKLLFGGQP